MKRGLNAVAVGVLIVGAGAAATSPRSVAPARGSAVSASCAGTPPAEQFAMARRVFIGRMLPGASTSTDHVLSSPATVRVLRYLKGSGPRTVRVRTAVTITNSGVTVAEDAITPRVGEIWKIYTNSRRQPFDTSICGGSTRIRSAVQEALHLCNGFPVQAKPRPIVPLGEGVVLHPSPGFPDDSKKIAFSEGAFALGTALPTSPATVGGRRILSAAAAYVVLRASGRPSGIKVAPLIIRAVRHRTATLLTDRGRRRLPAWQFSFRGVAMPASVLALAPPDLFRPPPLQQLGPPGPGNSIEDSARADRSGRAITIFFIGTPPGTGPCNSGYSASGVTNRRAVAFTIRTITNPAPPGTVCTAVGAMRTAVLHLARPLGARVLISSSDGGAVAVAVAVTR